MNFDVYIQESKHRVISCQDEFGDMCICSRDWPFKSKYIIIVHPIFVTLPTLRYNVCQHPKISFINILLPLHLLNPKTFFLTGLRYTILKIKMEAISPQNTWRKKLSHLRSVLPSIIISNALMAINIILWLILIAMWDASSGEFLELVNRIFFQKFPYTARRYWG
jgi:hypothetical protein